MNAPSAPGIALDPARIDGSGVRGLECAIRPYRDDLVATEEMTKHRDLRLTHRRSHVIECGPHLLAALGDPVLDHRGDERRLDRAAVGNRGPGHVEARQRDHAGESTLAAVPDLEPDRAPDFLSGIELARAYYEEVVEPLIGDVPHAAGRLGWGSDVLGFDTERSTDHGWGPHLHVFVDGEDAEPVRALVAGGLPETFRGWPTHFGWDETPVQHWVEVRTLGEWLVGHLGVDPRPRPNTREWMLLPQQLILGVVGGAVFRDDFGELTALRRELEWYPDDLWLWLIACQWNRISQEESFVGRTTEVGDDLGSSVLAARLTRDVMRLCFLLERKYAPYSKWFGTAFARLDAADEVAPLLQSGDLSGAYEVVARRHNALGITRPLEPTVRPYYGRPYLVLFAERFVGRCLERVQDPWLRALPRIGAIDQWVDSTDVLSSPELAQRLAAAYPPIVGIDE